MRKNCHAHTAFVGVLLIRRGEEISVWLVLGFPKEKAASSGVSDLLLLFLLSIVCPCLSYRANCTAQLTPWLWLSWWQGADLPAMGVLSHGMCPCLYRKVLCLPCCAEFSLPWLILHWWLQHWYNLDSREWSPFSQQILLNHHFMKKTKILSIFSHPPTPKSMPVLRAALVKVLQSDPSHVCHRDWALSSH